MIVYILLKLALVVALAHPAAVLAQASKKVATSHATQRQFDSFIAKFRAALKANDAAAVTSMTKLPYMTDNPDGSGSDYPDATQFQTKGYPKIFTPRNRACIQRTKGHYDRNPLGSDSFSIPCGDDIFVFTKTPAGFLFTDVSVND